MGSTYGEPFVDWPIGYEDLAPFYDRVEWEMGVSGPAGPRPHDGPRSRGYPMPPLPPNAARARARPRRPGARAGHRRGAAADQLGALRRAPGVHPLRHLRRLRVPRRRQERQPQHDDRARARQRPLRPPHRRRRRRGWSREGSRVVGAELARPGRRVAVRAGHVVVAAGAIETARLLLVSDVGNAHDQVGRHLQGHVYAGAVGVFDEQVQDCAGPGPSISTTDFRHHNDGILGGGILANEFVPIPIEAYAKLSAAGIVPAWGEAGAEALRDGLHAHPARRRADPGGAVGRLPRHARARGHRRQRHARRAPARRRARAERPARGRVPGAARGGVAGAPAARGGPRRCGGRSPRAPARASTRPAPAAWAAIRARR